MFKFEPKGNQKYDTWLQYNTDSPCSLDCIYCFAKERRKVVLNELKMQAPEGLPTKVSVVLNYLEYLKKHPKGFNIEVPALLKTLDKTGKVFHIVFTGIGEPFLVSNLIEACEKVSKKHYVSIITNLTTAKVSEFCCRINPVRVVLIHASVHIKELESKGLMDVFINNFLLCKNKGFPIVAYEVAHPSLSKEADKYRTFFRKRGIRLLFASFRGKYLGRVYPKAYTDQEIKAFDLKKEDIDNHYQRGNVCNAGHNVGVVTLSGAVTACYSVPTSLGDVLNGIKFRKGPIICPERKCDCPVNRYDPRLFLASLKSAQKIKEISCLAKKS